MAPKPHIKVVCAILEHKGKILAVRRKSGEHHEGCWEFPGGKVKDNETFQGAIGREIREELEIEVEPIKILPYIEYEYPEFYIRLIPVYCKMVSGKITYHVHDLHRWLRVSELPRLTWSNADALLLKKIVPVLSRLIL